MSREIKISFLGKIRRPNTGNKFLDRFLAIVTVLIYPVILLSGLIVLLFAWLFSFWQRLTTANMSPQKEQQNTYSTSKQNSQWSTFTSIGNVLIEQQFAGSLPWDSGGYLYLRSKPSIPYFEDKLFGDWLLVDFGGVFLQKWNETRDVNCDLVFFDCKTLKIKELIKGLSTKDWIVDKVNANEIKFTFITVDGGLVYTLKQEEAQ